MLQSMPPNALTPEIFEKVCRGEGTPAEAQLASAAIKTPASDVHAWLGPVPDWTKQQLAFHLASPNYDKARATGGKAFQRRGGQRFLEIVNYVMDKRKEGQLSDEDVQYIFSAGIADRIKKTDGALTSHQFDIVIAAARINLRDRKPELADDLNRVFVPQMRKQ